MPSADRLIELRHIQKHYLRKSWPWKAQTLRAVDGVSLSFGKGETLGLVGESGCGKSTVGQIAARLLEPSGGKLIYDGTELDGSHSMHPRKIRQRIQYVFQDPYSSLNPRFTIGRLLEEPLAIHRLGDKKERRRRVDEMLETIGLDSSFGSRYPHELSGGQRQRIGIARALMLRPEFVVLDEPVSALDVSVQAQILNLLRSLQRELSLTYLFISHDLNVVHYMSDRVAVMYLGKVVEIAAVEELYDHPLHPYTEALVSSIPTDARHAKREKIILKGDLPNPLEVSSGCPFQSRCRYAFSRCEAEAPVLAQWKEGHAVSCHLYMK
ncbi:ATP-binding cassette domain-containing protein [Paenibacillus sp. JMULE4]|uniref:ABC transporter ATP-binding protein n=1 Tax=Paenibacillus sp. JMULE4 TaxID=2518342 RepID=UPI00157595E1|nr:oligopeptide/dipeptide ABC transporter ATP-binding protein [Paenibacillus sp. JMULE4]NTZ18647.1 ATP-binding cassette domain-containing protein [Paenibacillus sp. JMULE4]